MTLLEVKIGKATAAFDGKAWHSKEELLKRVLSVINLDSLPFAGLSVPARMFAAVRELFPRAELLYMTTPAESEPADRVY